MITQESFGKTADGKEVLAFTLSDGASHVKILNLGGIVQSIVVPDRKGTPTDVALGYNTVKEYEQNDGYLGALIGRFGNRIGKGELTVEGKKYALYCNDRGNHLHGGKVGFNAKIWEHAIEGDTLVLTLFSPDGEENYPGNLKVTVKYSFQGGALKICYHAVSDKATAVNLTNHTYFNLSGEGDGSILDHELTIDSDLIVPTNETQIPEGGLRAVKGTPFDFNEAKPIGRDIGAKDIDLLRGNGYDHSFVLKAPKGEMKEYGSIQSPKTGIRMRCFTDMPAVQLYTGNGLSQQGKTAYYGKRAAFCLETGDIPNNVNVPEYAALGSSVLKAGEEYTHTCIYKFEA